MSTSEHHNKNKHDNNQLLTTMFITANVGTIFEESSLLELWFNQLKTYLERVEPRFVAIHCQEVGGKNFVSSMKHMSLFTEKITRDDFIPNQYRTIRFFLDEDYESLERFTALGSIYLVHHTVENFKVYNFKTTKFDSIEGISVNSFTPSKQLVDHVQKIKFPENLFPGSGSSRKGFMRTRWLFNDRQLVDLVNIHLFHDASNLVAMEATPSRYAQNRQRALEFTLETIAKPLKTEQEVIEERRKFLAYPHDQLVVGEENLAVPLFIFGDFNFRLDTRRVIERISKGTSPKIERCRDSNEVLQVVYHISDEQEIQVPEETTSSTEQSSSKATSRVEKETDIESKTSLEDEPKLKGISSVQETSYQRVTCEDDQSSGGPIVMTIGKKLFDFEDLDDVFRAAKNSEWLQEMDNELDSFRTQLFEFKISFSPSYPFKEDFSGAHCYMKTRCPSWCDRILFNSAGSKVIHSSMDDDRHDGQDEDAKKMQQSRQLQDEQLKQQEQRIQGGDIAAEVEESVHSVIKRVELLQDNCDIQYQLLGNTSPMGDHKPVLLYCQLAI